MPNKYNNPCGEIVQQETVDCVLCSNEKSEQQNEKVLNELFLGIKNVIIADRDLSNVDMQNVKQFEERYPDYCTKQEKCFCGECRQSYYKDRMSRYDDLLKTRAIQEFHQDTERRCVECGYNKSFVILKIHHINGNKNDFRHSNLVYLCPTCKEYIEYMENLYFHVQFGWNLSPSIDDMIGPFTEPHKYCTWREKYRPTQEQVEQYELRGQKRIEINSLCTMIAPLIDKNT